MYSYICYIFIISPLIRFAAQEVKEKLGAMATYKILFLKIMHGIKSMETSKRRYTQGEVTRLKVPSWKILRPPYLTEVVPSPNYMSQLIPYQ
jgi:hypothetical protein